MRSHKVSFRHACELLLKEHPSLAASGSSSGPMTKLSAGKLRSAQSFQLPAGEADGDQVLLDQVIEFYHNHQTLKNSPEALGHGRPGAKTHVGVSRPPANPHRHQYACKPRARQGKKSVVLGRRLGLPCCRKGVNLHGQASPAMARIVLSLYVATACSKRRGHLAEAPRFSWPMRVPFNNCRDHSIRTR